MEEWRVGWVENRSIYSLWKRWEKGILNCLWRERKEIVTTKKSRGRKGRGRKKVASLEKHGKAEGKGNIVIRNVEKGLLVEKVGHEKVYKQYDLWWKGRTLEKIWSMLIILQSWGPRQVMEEKAQKLLWASRRHRREAGWWPWGLGTSGSCSVVLRLQKKVVGLIEGGRDVLLVRRKKVTREDFHTK